MNITSLQSCNYKSPEYKDFDVIAKTALRLIPAIQAIGCEKHIPLSSVVEMALLHNRGTELTERVEIGRRIS